MKTHKTFALILLVGFIGKAQTLNFDRIEDGIAIRPSLALIDFSDKSFVISDNRFSFNTFTYSQNLTKPIDMFEITSTVTDIMRDDFVVFSHKHLRKNFFEDFNMTYRRDALKRLLPRSLDPSYYNPCIPGD